jgi:hypothetical protein
LTTRDAGTQAPGRGIVAFVAVLQVQPARQYSLARRADILMIDDIPFVEREYDPRKVAASSPRTGVPEFIASKTSTIIRRGMC